MDFPTVDSLLPFVKDRIEVLENSGSSMVYPPAKPRTKSSSNDSRSNHYKPKSSSSKHFNNNNRTPVSLVANKPSDGSQQCLQCNKAHSLSFGPSFKDLSINDRYLQVSNHRLCLICFSNNHWANQCKSSCSICYERHHQLLHRDNSHAKVEL